MAFICSSSTSSSITLWLSGLDTKWESGLRSVNWYIGYGEGDVPSETSYNRCIPACALENNEPESSPEVFEHLDPGTEYEVYCTVYHEDTLLNDFYTTVSTTNGWSCIRRQLGTRTELTSLSITLKPYQIYRVSVAFEASGTAIFYTEGTEVDTVGFLSETTDWFSSSGEPMEYFIKDDDGNGVPNFRITYDVTEGINYFIWVRAWSENGSGSTTLFIEPPEGETIQISHWRWDYTNGMASTQQTFAAYKAIYTKTEVANFSYLVWNDMVDKVNNIIGAIGDYWNPYYLDFENTRMTASDKILTAVRFNSLRYNVGSRFSTGIPEVFTGGDVLGEYFLTLAQCINDWIDSL